MYIHLTDINICVLLKINASKHGYFEASPNHDAIFLRIVDDAIAEGIMALTDKLQAKIRPHTFMIPNTDAGERILILINQSRGMYINKSYSYDTQYYDAGGDVGYDDSKYKLKHTARQHSNSPPQRIN